MEKAIEDNYKEWLEKVTVEELLKQLKKMDESEIEDSFYRDLTFGTGGLRGIIGAGTNRMNLYTVAKASQGLSDYIVKEYKEPFVVIGYDSRNMSLQFANEAAMVFVANGIKVWMWSALTPVPTVSYAIRYLHASQGIMITASHNPAEYNGYKVYGDDGCQITTEAASAIYKEIEKLDIFTDIKKIPMEKAEKEHKIGYIPSEVMDSYIGEVKKQSVLFGDKINRDVAIVYSPLNGTGLVPVSRVLKEAGFTNITIVEEQKNPDGNFPTCSYPNPEVREAMELGLEYCKKIGADLLLATDPDADRCGIAVRDGDEYKLLTGNEVGLLLLDYVCAQRVKHNMMPNNPVFIKTIVTSDLAEKIAEHYGVHTINVLTGFKFIGEQIGYLEKEGRKEDYICGFEESYGYLTGSYVRDKDAVNAAFMICEMFAYYKIREITLIDKLNELYRIHGYCLNTLHSYDYPGVEGNKQLLIKMKAFRERQTVIGGKKILYTEDYLSGVNGLPRTDVIKFYIENGTVVIRPSGTEPKLKVYICLFAKSKDETTQIEERIVSDIREM